MIDGTIPTRTAVVLQRTASRLGAPSWQIDGAVGVDERHLGDEQVRIPIESAWRMWELIGSIGGPGAGLCASATAARGVLGVWDYLFTSRPTLADSLRTVMELRSAVTDPTVVWEVLEDGALLTVRVGVAVESDPVFVPVEEFVLSLILRRIREATGAEIVPMRVAFTHRVTHRRRDLIDEFGTSRIDFGMPFSEITFLDAGRLPTGGDPALGEVFSGYAKLLLSTSRPVAGWRERLHLAISEALTDNDFGLDSVARRLSISSRTLQRRLCEMDSTWSDELDRVRQEQVDNLLRGTELPIESVAARVGYADARSLRRAFHRWTGQTPAAYRRDLEDKRAG